MVTETVRRAFEVAPQCETMEELRAKLHQEGCTNIDAHLKDSLRRDLKRLLKSRA